MLKMLNCPIRNWWWCGGGSVVALGGVWIGGGVAVVSRFGGVLVVDWRPVGGLAVIWRFGCGLAVHGSALVLSILGWDFTINI